MVLGNIDTVGIPVVTITPSGHRELRILKYRKTDIKTAAKNIALDMFGTGIGGSSGATFGAFLGPMMFPGIGTVVSVTVGAIGVGTVGRKITNKVKRKPLRKAEKAYEEVRQDALPKIKSLLENAHRHSVTEIKIKTDSLLRSSAELKEARASCKTHLSPPVPRLL